MGHIGQPWHCDNALLISFLPHGMSMQPNAVISFFSAAIRHKKKRGLFIYSSFLFRVLQQNKDKEQ